MKTQCLEGQKQCKTDWLGSFPSYVFWAQHHHALSEWPKHAPAPAGWDSLLGSTNGGSTRACGLTSRKASALSSLKGRRWFPSPDIPWLSYLSFFSASVQLWKLCSPMFTACFSLSIIWCMPLWHSWFMNQTHRYVHCQTHCKDLQSYFRNLGWYLGLSMMAKNWQFLVTEQRDSSRKIGLFQMQTRPQRQSSRVSPGSDKFSATGLAHQTPITWFGQFPIDFTS